MRLSLPLGTSEWIGALANRTDQQNTDSVTLSRDCGTLLGVGSRSRHMKRDSLIMLLSSNWFSSQWAAIGLSVDRRQEDELREGCRRIVMQIMNAASEYWLTSFSPQRCEVTDSMFRTVLSSVGLEESTLQRINRLVGESSRVEFDILTKTTVIELTEKLLAGVSSDDVPELDMNVRERMIAVWDKWHQQQGIDFDEECLSSNSDWDIYLRSLTPDLPTWLSDYVFGVVEEQDKFNLLWDFINTGLTASERNKLLLWYESAARTLMHRALNLFCET